MTVLQKTDENSDKGYIFFAAKNLHKFHGELPVLPERMKINKCNKLVCTVQDKKTMLFT